MSPGRRPASTSSRSRCAIRRASARRAGCGASVLRPTSTPSHPALSVISSSTGGSPVATGSGSNRRSGTSGVSRPAISGPKRSPSSLGEGAVEDVEQLLARPEVARQAAHAPGAEPLPALAEDRHVGVAEAVDRLELVADREQVRALERLEHVELEPVRVLELVDHDQVEALAPLAPRAGVGEQVAHAQLEVGEVDPGARGLRRLVLAAETVQQVVEQHQRRPRVVVRARRPVLLPRGPVGDARVVLERLRPRPDLARGRAAPASGRAPRRRPGARRRRALRAPPRPSSRRRRARARPRRSSARRAAPPDRGPAARAGSRAAAGPRRGCAGPRGRPGRSRSASARTRRRGRPPARRAPPPSSPGHARRPGRRAASRPPRRAP